MFAGILVAICTLFTGNSGSPFAKQVNIISNNDREGYKLYLISLSYCQYLLNSKVPTSTLSKFQTAYTSIPTTSLTFHTFKPMILSGFSGCLCTVVMWFIKNIYCVIFAYIMVYSPVVSLIYRPIYKQKCLPVCRSLLEGDGRGGGKGAQNRGQEGRGQWGGGISQMDMMDCLGGHRYRAMYLSLYINRNACLSVHHVWRGVAGEAGRVDRKEGSNGEGSNGEGGLLQMAMMKCQANGMDKHMECLGGMWLQSFLTDGHLAYPCNAGYPS